jgi:arylsulfatase A-like enzyme/Flp pilus assembly protein TadD
MVVIRGLVFITAFATAAPAASRPVSSPPKSPNIILITLDTTRADRMGFLGSTRKLTPNLDALARQSVVFSRAYAQAPVTPPSHATILTGTYPQFHQLNDMQTPLARDLPYGPQILREHGYQTAAFIGSIVLQPEPPYAPGFDRGFDLYDAGFHNEGPGEDRYSTVQRRGAEVVAHALAWMSKHPRGPFFVWIHLYDAHDPYDPPEPYKTRNSSAPYDGALEYEDYAVGKLLRQLKVRGLFDGALVAVMADHGESLGAHGEDTHGVFLYDETIHVPLLIKLPRGTSGGNKIEERVELVDVMPTLLQRVGIAIPQQMQGESLLALMKPNAAAPESHSETWRDRPAYSQAEYSHDTFGWSALRSLRSGKYLYVQAPHRELYDEAADPNAENNLAPSTTAVADTLARELRSLHDETVNHREVPKPAPDPSAQEKLGALGYMASSSGNSKIAPDEGADPKDHIEIANMIHRAEVLQQDQHFDESIALLERIIAKNPTSSFYEKLGAWLIRNQEFLKAVPPLTKALQMDPDSNGLRFLLGKSLIMAQDFNGAIPVLEKLIEKVPNAVEAHSFLQLAYARTNRPLDAIKECKVVLQYDPNDYGSYLILGQSLGRSGNPLDGIATLKKAALMEPGDPTPHLWLAEIYDQMGNLADAEQQRADAERLGAVRSN